jgi:hypothetical protein
LKIQRYVKVIYDGVEFKGVWDKKGEYLRCDLCYWTNERIIKVVGNVFDNPEMMERGKE